MYIEQFLFSERDSPPSINREINPSFIARTQKALAHTQEWQTDNLHLHRIKEFAQTKAPHIYEKLAKPSEIDPEKVATQVATLSPKQVEHGFKRTVNLLLITDYFNDIEDEHLASGLLRKIDNGHYKSRLNMIKPGGWLDFLFTSVSGKEGYNPWVNMAFIVGDVPSYQDLWKSIINTGKLPPVMARIDKALVADHGYTRKQQALHFTPYVIRWAVKGSLDALVGPWAGIPFSFLSGKPAIDIGEWLFRNDPRLTIVHGDEAVFYSPTFFDESVTATEFAGMIADQFDQADQEKVKAAFYEIHKLRVLGTENGSDTQNMNDIKIGRLVSRSRYKKETKSYSHLNTEVARLEETWGINSGAIPKHEILAAAEACFELRLVAAREQARKVALKVLTDMTSIHPRQSL